MKTALLKLLSGCVITAILLCTMPYQSAMAAEGGVDTTFNNTGSGPDGAVYVIVRQADGKILLGGNFTSYNGDANAPDRILRLNADGSLDMTFNYGTGARGANDEIWAIAIQSDDKILIGGYFTAYNGNATLPKYLIRLNADGSLDTTFNNAGSGPNSAVLSLAMQPADNYILVGGNFITYNGLQAPDRIMRLNTTGALDPAFNAGAGTRGANGSVETILVQPDGLIVIGGGFNSYNGPSNIRHHILRLNPDGSLDPTFTGSGTESLADVRALVRQPDGRIVVAGYFTTYNTASVPNGLMRINGDGSLDGTFNPGGSGPFVSGYHVVNSLVLQTDGRIVLGGYFTSYNGDEVAPDHIIRVNSDGSLDNTFNYGAGRGANGEVFSLALQPDGKVLVAGSFTGYNDGSPAAGSTLRLANVINFDPVATDEPSKIVSSLPSTGFTPGLITVLPYQPLEKAYTSYDELKLEIPVIKVNITIVGVPLADRGWDVSWLGTNAGWLNGSAFPTRSGNSVITGHVWDASDRPGPFVKLKTLKYGDQVRIRAWGQVYTYEVRLNNLVSPNNPAVALKHEDLAWVTLLTCEDYTIFWNTYTFRRMVRAVLVNVSMEN